MRDNRTPTDVCGEASKLTDDGRVVYNGGKPSHFGTNSRYDLEPNPSNVFVTSRSCVEQDFEPFHTRQNNAVLGNKHIEEYSSRHFA